MIRFAEVFSDKKIVHALSAQLTWTHFLKKLSASTIAFNVIYMLRCAGKTSEQIELLQLDKFGIKVAEYMTELPKRELLEQKLHKAVELARKRLEAKAT